jgi:hypothetical protein
VSTPAGAWRVSLRANRDRWADVCKGGVTVARWGAIGRDHALAQRRGDVCLRADLLRTPGGGVRGEMAHVPHGWVPYRVLTGADLPPCLMVNPTPSGLAVATPRGHMNSVLIDDRGTIREAAAWPLPIVAEYHSACGQLAWSFTKAVKLLFREAANSSVLEQPVPFVPFSAVWWDRATALISSDQGVWLWSPGREPERLVALPPCAISRRRGDAVELDPLPLVGGSLVRARAATAWTLAVPSGTVTGRALTREGQAWTTAVNGGRVATTHSEGHVVGLSSVDGDDQQWLTWPRPRGAVWLADSLLLGTATGEIVLFPGLSKELDRFDAHHDQSDDPA